MESFSFHIEAAERILAEIEAGQNHFSERDLKVAAVHVDIANALSYRAVSTKKDLPPNAYGPGGPGGYRPG